MRPSYISRSLLACALLFAGCGPRDRVFNPVHFQPAGVMIPAEIVRDRSMTGIFTEKADPALTGICCWIAPHAQFHLEKNARARSLRLNGYLPDDPVFRNRPQRVTLSFPGSAWRHVWQFKAGFQTLSARLPAALSSRQGDLLVTLDCSVPFPAAGQRYGIVLTSVYFE